MNNKTIAIAGFSLNTLPALKDSRADEIWTLNHAFVMDFAFPRFDRVFELHRYGWFLRKGQYTLTRYRNWLRQKHPFPIYMQKEYKSFPSSVRYPIDEINQLIFGKLLRGEERNLYYTSSFSYMLALAIYEGVKRVEIYGVDMTNDTEYNYQKPGGELMIGVALGHGIEIALQPNSDLCKAQWYGYDKVPAADRKRAEELAELYEREHADFKARTEAQAELISKREVKDPAGYMQCAAFSAMYYGGAQVLRHMLSGDEYFFGRQHLENERHKYRKEEENYLAKTNEAHAAFETYAKLDTDGNTGRAWKEYLNTRWSMYANSGARQAVQKLIDECDMRVVPDELRLEIVDG
jgi:protein-tyrosine-phosphatase